MKFKNIIFDFDGVIVDSNPIKKDTYFITFSQVKGSRKIIEEAIIENPRKTRYGVIEAILKKLKKRGLIQFNNLKDKRDNYVTMYGEITERETIKAEEIKGVERQLSNLSKKYSLFVLTSTIQKSIDKVVNGRGLKKYFKGVYGADSGTQNKPRILKRIIKEHNFDPKEAVFVGDSEADYECAKYFGMTFIGIKNETNDFAARDDVKYKLSDLTKLSETLKEIELQK